MLSFNPYSIGFYSLIELGNLKIEESSHGFNPYSIGFYSLIFPITFGRSLVLPVSILILLDSILLSVLHRRLFIFNSYRVFLRI